MRRYRTAPVAQAPRAWDDDNTDIPRPSSLVVFEDDAPWRGIGIIDPNTGRELQGWFGLEPIGFLAHLEQGE